MLFLVQGPENPEGLQICKGCLNEPLGPLCDPSIYDAESVFKMDLGCQHQGDFRTLSGSRVGSGPYDQSQKRC